MIHWKDYLPIYLGDTRAQEIRGKKISIISSNRH